MTLDRLFPKLALYQAELRPDPDNLRGETDKLNLCASAEAVRSDPNRPQSPRRIPGVVTAADIGRALGGKKTGRGWSAMCPAHADVASSLFVGDDPHGPLLLSCFAGCSAKAIRAALVERELLSTESAL